MRKLHKFYRPVIAAECLPHWCYRLLDEKTGRILPFKIHASRLKPIHLQTRLLRDKSSKAQPTAAGAIKTATEQSAPPQTATANDRSAGTPPTHAQSHQLPLSCQCDTNRSRVAPGALHIRWARSPTNTPMRKFECGHVHVSQKVCLEGRLFTVNTHHSPSRRSNQCSQT